MRWRKLIQICISLLLTGNLILPGFNLPQRDIFVLSPVSPLAPKLSRKPLAPETITPQFLNALADIAIALRRIKQAENINLFLEHLKAASLSPDKGFDLPQSLEISKISSYDEKIPGAFLVEFKVDSKLYILLVAPSQKLKEAFDKGLVSYVAKKEYQGKIDDTTYLLYDSVRFREEPDWFFYLEEGKGRFAVSNIDNIKETPTIIFENKEGEDKTPGSNLRKRVEKLVQTLVQSPELGFIHLWNSRIRKTSTRRITKASTGIIAVPDQAQLQLEITLAAPQKIRLGSSLGKEYTLEIPALLFRTSHPTYLPAQLKAGLEFCARYALRQAFAEELYGEKNETVVQTLILLEWIHDFIHLEGMEQTFIIELLKEILPDDQKDFRDLLVELQNQDFPKIDEKLVESAIRFVQSHILSEKQRDYLSLEPSQAEPSPIPSNVPASLKEEVMAFWKALESPNATVRTFFAGVAPSLPAETRLYYLRDYLAFTLTENTNLRRLLGEYLESLEKSKEAQKAKQTEGLDRTTEVPFTKAVQMIHNFTLHSRIRRECYEQLRKVVFRTLYELAIEEDSNVEKNGEHSFLREMIDKHKTSERVPFEHAIDYWLDLCLEQAKKLHLIAISEQTPSKKKETLDMVEKFLNEVDIKLKSWKNLPYYFSKAEKVREMRSQIQKEKESAEVLSAQNMEDPTNIPFAKILTQLEKAVNMRWQLQEKKKEILSLLIQNQNPSTAPQALVLLAGGSAKRAKNIVRFFGELTQQSKESDGSIKQVEDGAQDAIGDEIVDKIFRDEVAKILSAAVLVEAKTKDGKMVIFSPDQFYEMLMLVAQSYEGSEVLNSEPFCETLLYLHLKKAIVAKVGNPNFNLAFSKFMERSPKIEGLSPKGDEPIETLFEWYASMLRSEQHSGFQPYEHQEEVRRVLKEKIQKRREEIAQNKGPTFIGRIWQKAVGVVAGVNLYSLPPQEFEGEIEPHFLNAVEATLNHRYSEASREFQILMRTLVRFHDNEIMKFRAQNIQGKELTQREIYEMENVFYREWAPLRLMFKSAWEVLKYIREENKNYKAFDEERLSASDMESLCAFLERDRYKSFLRKVLPAMETIRIKGENKEVRLYDFLEMGEGGKEGQFQILRYAFFGSKIYDFLGYYIVEVPQGKNGNFALKRYVTKLAQTPHVTDLYEKLFKGYFPDIKNNTQRFENNHFKERFVNQFIKAFKQFLNGKGEEEFAELLDVPELMLSDDISGGEDPDKQIQLLMIEFVTDLFEMEIPKTSFSRQADSQGVLGENEEVKKSIDDIVKILKGRRCQERMEKGLPPKEAVREAQRRFEKMRALSVGLNTLLRNVDYGPFVSKTGLVILDMEATLPQVYSSRFSFGLNVGDMIKEEEGRVVEVRRPNDDAEKQELQKQKFQPFDPQKPVDTFFTWRLNNIFIEPQDAHDENFKRIYTPLMELMLEFLNNPTLDFQGLDREQTKKIEDYFRRAKDKLEEEVKILVQGRGVALLNYRGDVVAAKTYITPSSTADGEGTKTVDLTAEEAGDDLDQFTVQVGVGKGDTRKTITISSPEEESLRQEGGKGSILKLLDELFESDKMPPTSPRRALPQQDKSEKPREKSSGRIERMTELDLMEEENFVTSVNNMQVIISQEASRAFFQETEGKASNFDADLYGRIEGDVFIVTRIIPDKEIFGMTLYLQKIKAAEENKEIYLGKWLVHKSDSDQKGVLGLPLTVKRLQDLPQKQERRERLILLVSEANVTDINEIRAVGVASEGKIAYNEQLEKNDLSRFKEIPQGKISLVPEEKIPPKRDSDRLKALNAAAGRTADVSL